MCVCAKEGTYLNATSVMTVSISPTRERTTPTRDTISIANSASSERALVSVLPLMSCSGGAVKTELAKHYLS